MPMVKKEQRPTSGLRLLLTVKEQKQVCIHVLLTALVVQQLPLTKLTLGFVHL